ncbi:uncharacterized protein LOC111300863 [Durio zibethinus]|uniref:Uncharacterized protein LOC111300863 n=1 Tax=Durio zibethinus TaxID=66656 RepID=A0A6P5ZHI3_DURZI|nr:uncharacterized protein LOC111300863 [Durio zibethinus]
MASTEPSSSAPSVKEEQPPHEKQQKLESNNNKDRDVNVFGFDDETLWRMLDYYEDDDGDADDSVDEDYSDGEREITDEEIGRYKAALEISDGFDVPSFPGVSCCGLITPVVLSAYSLETLKPLCVAAMEYYNNEKKTNYKFLELKKANVKGCCGLLYYLTFVGRIPEVNTTQIFEARVLWGIPKNVGDDPTEVYSCREKSQQTPPATTDYKLEFCAI